LFRDARARGLLLRVHGQWRSVVVGRAPAKSMVLNIVLVHLIGMLGTQAFWGANPRAPRGG
jgi:phospholipid/cholesterol/gamma-HCH transport system permease protein